MAPKSDSGECIQPVFLLTECSHRHSSSIIVIIVDLAPLSFILTIVNLLYCEQLCERRRPGSFVEGEPVISKGKMAEKANRCSPKSLGPKSSTHADVAYFCRQPARPTRPKAPHRPVCLPWSPLRTRDPPSAPAVLPPQLLSLKPDCF